LTDQATRVVPAGWYEDPASSAHVRWWNGLAWTEHTTLKPTPTPRPQPMTASYGDYGDGFGDKRYGDGFSQGDQVTQAGQSDQVTQSDQASHGRRSTEATPDEVTTSTGSTHTPETMARIAEARELERQYGISTAEHDIIMRNAISGEVADGFLSGSADGAKSAADSGYRAWDAEPEPEYEEPGTATASAWFIALWPLLTLAAAAAAAYLAFYVAPDPAVAGIPVVAALVLVPSLLTLIWAMTDARKLRSLGHRPASPALALLGPLIYLIGRRARVSGSGPLIALLLLTVLAAAAPTAAYLSGSSVTVTKALEIQQAVQATYVDSGQLASVSCPMFVDTFAQGSFYTCDGVTPEGTAKLVYVSFDTADGGYSTALSVRD
jgi:hypothetical protein